MGCCILGVCCPPDKQGRALAEHLADGEPEADGAGSYTDIARRLVEEFQLVPKSLEPNPDARPLASAAHVGSGKARLEKLHRHVQGELKAILIDLGHPVEEG